MSDESEAETQWTPSAKEAYAASVDQLIIALREHAQLTLDRSGRQVEHAPYSSSVERLFRAAASFNEAEFDWCGRFPLGLDADESDDEDEDEDETVDGDVLTVVGRWDYRVVDADGLKAAGRAAYTRAWPEDTEEDADVAIADPSAAAQEIAHAGGWKALDDARGLQPIASTVSVIIHQNDNTAWIDGDEDPFALTRED
ncbi:hypothetical protein [Diaminobutyricibacter sp. McL0608]|uniref:hypothetical protein n=1 Tax=Leifsonia sp. McL0608 TaxID=3143537 RepID=UPI0031F303C1